MDEITAIDTGANYCREKAAPDGSAFYYATLFEDSGLRCALFPLFALHYEVTDSLIASPDPGVTRLKLHWWFEEIQRLLDGHARHPVTRQLLPLLDSGVVDKPVLISYMDTVSSLTHKQSATTLKDWLDNYSSGLGLIWGSAGRISTTAEAPPAESIQRHGGMIFVLDLLQDINRFTTQGYDFLPDELLEKHHIPAERLMTYRDTEAAHRLFHELISCIAAELDSFYHTPGSSGLPYFHLIMNRISREVCSEIGRDNYRLLNHKIILTPIRKLRIAWWTRLVTRFRR